MKAYVLCFLIAFLLCVFSDFFYKKNKVLCIFFIVMSILLLSVFAGVRNKYVGTDINVYLSPLFKGFSNNTLSIFDAVVSQKIELGFALLVFITSKLNSLFWVLFFIQLIFLIPIFIVAYNNAENNSISFYILICLFTMYCNSFNLMRQSIAISFIILAIDYFCRTSNKKKTIYIILFASLFHYSALIGFLILYSIDYIKNNRKSNFTKFIYLISISFIVLFFLFLILSITNNKYSLYLYKNSLTSFNYLSLSKKVIWLFPVFIIFGKSSSLDFRNNCLIAIILISYDIVLYLCGLKLPVMSRLGFYFLNYSYFFTIPLIKSGFVQKKFITVLLIAILSVFWWHMTCVDGNSSGVYPYNSDMVTFLNSN